MLDDLRQQASLTYGEEAPTIEKQSRPSANAF
jgi:hypothetical protein